MFERIGIVGLGLMGGSLALACRKVYPAALVIAVDRKDVLETAMRLHAMDVATDELDVLAEADLVVLAAPVVANLALLAQLPGVVKGTAIVTDLGSTKRAMVEAARTVLPERLRFIGGHPLAGAARGGIDHARADLFEGRPWLFTPTAETAAADLDRLLQFVGMIGALPTVLAVAEHDHLVAALSHLPQLAASALMAVVGDRVGGERLDLAGRGLIDTTRLASSPPEIWRDIAATNADEIAPALDALIDALVRLRADLGHGDTLTEIFERAAAWRERLPR